MLESFREHPQVHVRMGATSSCPAGSNSLSLGLALLFPVVMTDGITCEDAISRKDEGRGREMASEWEGLHSFAFEYVRMEGKFHDSPLLFSLYFHY